MAPFPPSVNFIDIHQIFIIMIDVINNINNKINRLAVVCID